MFNVYDPKLITRGSVPTQVLPREQELELLRGLANPDDKNVPEEMRAAAVTALAKLEQEIADEQNICIQHWDVYEVQLPGEAERTQHVVGRVGWKQDFVVTDALVGINDETRIASTVAGARYELGGYVQGGVEVDTYWAWWRDKQGAVDVVRVTGNVKASLLSNRERE